MKRLYQRSRHQLHIDRRTGLKHTCQSDLKLSFSISDISSKTLTDEVHKHLMDLRPSLHCGLASTSSLLTVSRDTVTTLLRLHLERHLLIVMFLFRFTLEDNFH